MKGVDKAIHRIEQQRLGNNSRRVLIVEGPDDVHAVTSFLNNIQAFTGWKNHWHIEPAGNKPLVIEILAKKADWLGIIDPDEWSEEKLQEVKQTLDNLWVLPRFCIENYLIVPSEIYRAIGQNKFKGTDEAVLTDRITAQLDKWVAHGVLWHIINPLWAGLRVRGFKEALLESAIAQDEQTIQNTLSLWHDYLDPVKLYQRYQEKLSQVQQLSVEQKLLYWVHGKQFYESVVDRVLHELIGQQSAVSRQKDIFRHCPVPADFNPLWQKMGLQSA